MPSIHSKHRLTVHEKRLILRVNEYFKDEARQRLDPLKRRVRDRVAQCLRFAKSTIAEVVAAESEHEQWEKTVTRAAGSYATPVFYEKEIRNYVQECNLRMEPCTSKKVQQHLSDLLGVEVSDRTVRDWLKRLDFRFIKGKKRSHLAESGAVQGLRARYVRKKLENRTATGLPLRPEVFLDETYVNEHHATEKTWLPPGVDRVGASGVGPRFVIVGAGVLWRKHGRLRGDRVEDSLELWQSDRKHDHEDYHGNFTAEIFEDWFEKLCKTLHDYYGPTIIHMDRASYHLRCLNPHPNTTWRKAQIIEWLTDNRIYHEPTQTIKQLLQICNHNRQQKRYRSFEIAHSYGHKVLLTPPYHPELQPIELIWARVKNAIALEPIMPMHKLKNRIREEFMNLKSEDWIGAYKHVQPFEDEYSSMIKEGAESEIPIDEPTEQEADPRWLEVWTR